jgi:hypothetical protein
MSEYMLVDASAAYDLRYVTLRYYALGLALVRLRRLEKAVVGGMRQAACEIEQLVAWGCSANASSKSNSSGSGDFISVQTHCVLLRRSLPSFRTSN